MSAIDYSAPPHPCIYCREPTNFGSGRFVNRVPADADIDLDDGTTEHRDGYACEECIEEIGYSHWIDEGDAQYYFHMCRECADVAREDDPQRQMPGQPFWREDVMGGPIVKCDVCAKTIYDPSWDDTP